MASGTPGKPPPVVDVLARDDVNLRVPVTIQSVERSKLLLLLDAEVGEIFQDLFHVVITFYRYNVIPLLRNYPFIDSRNSSLLRVCIRRS